MTNNQTNKYPENIWYIVYDETNNNMMAQRTSNGITITVPATKEILEEIKKQMEAHKIFNAFQKKNVNDEHIIGYLNLILDDYINHLDTNSINNLIAKMKQISEVVDYQNTTYITQLITNLAQNNTDDFYETLEQFQSHNASYFATAFTQLETTTIKQH